jgi:hypothetical protein
VYAFTSGQDVWARFYDAQLNPITNEFQVNTNLTQDIQDEPALGIANNGRVLFAWSDRNGYDGEQMGIFGRVYGANGVPIGNEIQINQSWQASQWRPLIHPTPAGGWVVAWSGEWDGDAFIRILNSNGVPISGDIRVHQYFFDAQVDPAVAVDADGDIFVAFIDFSGHAGTATGLNLYGRAYNAGGIPYQANEFLITTWSGNGDQRQPRVAAFDDGFVVAYESAGGDGNGFGILARLYDDAGGALGPEFQVNEVTAGNQINCSVTAAPTGEFAIAWEDRSLGTPRIAARRYDAQALPIGGEFVVAQNGLGRERPILAMDAQAEDLLVAYDGSSGGFEALDTFSRHYAFSEGPLVFCEAKVNSAGCLPAIGYSGQASESSPLPFFITATQVRNHNVGILVYGRDGMETPSFGGTFCIANFLSRTPPQMSGGGGGHTCLGAYSLDFNAIIQAPGYPGLYTGATIVAQYLYRDPQDPFGMGLTDALRFAICP